MKELRYTRILRQLDFSAFINSFFEFQQWYNSSPSSSGTCKISGRAIPQMPDLPMTYRLEQRMVESERDLERSMEFFVDRTREEVVPPSLSRGPSFLSTERDEFPSTSRSVASCRDVDGDREPDDESDSSSLSWLQICKKPTEDNPVICNLSGSSDYPSSSDGRFFAPSERQHNRQSVSGSRSYDEPSPGKPMHRDDPSQPQYTPELAAVLLQGFGLEKEDLEYLLTFPEDQINSENLALILKQIRLMKEKRTTTQSYSDPQPSTSFHGPDTPSSSRGPEMDQDDIATRILKPAKVIDYGHSGSYTVVGREMGNSSKITNDCTGSMRGTYSSSSYKEPLKPSTLGVKSSSAVPLYGVTISPTNFTSMRTSTNTEAKKHHSSVKSVSSSSASKMKVFKGNPLRSMINDYKAAEPPAFPHRCTLCDKKCTAMKVSGVGCSFINNLEASKGAVLVRRAPTTAKEIGPVAAPVLVPVLAAHNVIAEKEDTPTAAPIPTPAALIVTMTARGRRRNTVVTGM
ncbi:hypothetical protein GOODEAATRI_017898 [Goodea atripinnis]|uniref:Uncharacterized protein n=1 Tax=Goodea atripinnis TaxID=208336 RepID=A0ABV0NBI9_9TELE